MRLRGVIAKALIGVLGYRLGTRTTRSELAELLWGGSNKRAALHSLSQSLYSIRRTLPEGAIEVSPESIALAQHSWIVDLDRLRRRIVEGSFQEAAEIWCWDFLSDIQVESVNYQHWRDSARARLHREVAGCLHRAADIFDSQGRWSELISVCDKWLQLDPHCFTALRKKALALAAEGDTRAALSSVELSEAGDEADRSHLLDQISKVSVAGFSPSLPPEPPFVGRHTEFETLRSTWDRVANRGLGEAILVRGEPGIGKSRILERFARYVVLHGGSALRADCTAAESHIQYSGIAETLRNTDLRQRTGLTKLQADIVASLLGRRTEGVPDTSPSSQSFQIQLLEALTAAITGPANDKPTAVLIDNAQWLDASSAAVVQQLLKLAFDSPPILVLLAARPEELQKQTTMASLVQDNVLAGRLRLLDLRCLPAPISDQLIKDASLHLGVNLTPALETSVRTRSGGNPFLIVQLLYSARSGELEHPQRQWPAARTSVSLPAAIDLFLRSRLATLSEEEQSVVRAAAVLGRSAAVPVLASISGLSSAVHVREQADRLIQRGVFAPDRSGGVGFAHDLLQECAYRQVPPLARAELHLAVAILEESTNDFGAAALNYSLAGKKACAYQCALVAAAAAIGRGAPRESEYYLELAEENATSQAAVAGVLLQLADLSFRFTSYRGAESVLLRLLEPPFRDLITPTDLIRARVRLLASKTYLGDATEAQVRSEGNELIRQARALGDPTTIAEALEVLCFTAIHVCSRDTLLALNAPIAALLESQYQPSPDFLIAASNGALFLGDRERALSIASRGLSGAEQSDSYSIGRFCSGIGCVLGNSGNFRDAERYLLRSLAAYEESGVETLLYRPLSNLGVLLIDQDRLDEAEQAFTRILKSNLAPPVATCGALLNLALIALERGFPDLVETYWRQAEKWSTQQLGFHMLPGRALLGLSYWARGMTTEAIAIAGELPQDADELLFLSDSAPAILLLAKAEEALRGEDAAVEFLLNLLEKNRFLMVTTEWQTRLELARLLRKRGSDESLTLAQSVRADAERAAGFLYTRKVDEFIQECSRA